MAKRVGENNDSPALALVRHIWEHKCEAAPHSWQRVNGSMYDAVKLAIEAGVRFAPGDFADICKEFRGGYWFGVDGNEMFGESFYSHAVASANVSACQSFETWKGRPPFIFGGARLHLGARFEWKGLEVKITSFSKDGAAIGACSYKRVESGSGHWKYEREKVDRRFRISIDDLRAVERERRKAEEEKREAALTPEEKKRRDDKVQAKKREQKYAKIITRAVETAKKGGKLYKVVGANGESIHGGTLIWTLPEGERPGQWHKVNGSLQLCNNGIHVTGNPQAYWTLNARVFECEVRGTTQGDPYAAPGYKAAVRSCRLLRELGAEELVKFGIETARGQKAA